MDDFTPVSGLVGGLLIGLAVALMLLLNGRIAGVSGIVGGLMKLRTGDTGWRAAFVIGLPLGALAYILVAGGPATVDVLASPPAILIGVCWSASAPAWGRAAPAATDCAASRSYPGAIR